MRSEEHTSELQSRQYLVCRLLLEKKKKNNSYTTYGHGQRDQALRGASAHTVTRTISRAPPRRSCTTRRDDLIRVFFFFLKEPAPPKISPFPPPAPLRP